MKTQKVRHRSSNNKQIKNIYISFTPEHVFAFCMQNMHLRMGCGRSYFLPMLVQGKEHVKLDTSD